MGKQVIVDVEADGPVPGLYSMVSFGAVLLLNGNIESTFYGELKPISEKWIPGALAVSGFSREETLAFKDPVVVMKEFEKWLNDSPGNGRPHFYSDNNGFDWSFINYYFHAFCGNNPFGHSSRNINDLYKGIKRDFRARWRHLRQTKHTHNPLNDAMGNAEALQTMCREAKMKL